MSLAASFPIIPLGFASGKARSRRVGRGLLGLRLGKAAADPAAALEAKQKAALRRLDRVTGAELRCYRLALSCRSRVAGDGVFGWLLLLL